MPVSPLQKVASPPVPGRRERQRLETRERIYQAALEEFRRSGYAAAQIEPIVERAGVARGTFYFHFPTKEHVLLEAQRRIEREIVEHLSVAFDERPRSVKAFLMGVIQAMIEGGRSAADPALGREILAIYAREPRVVDASAHQLIVALVDYFAEAAERGEVRSDLTPEEIAGIFLTSLFGYVATAVDPPEDRLHEFASTIDVFVRGIQP